ncbi:hypothetical protein IDJ75_01745 [Mucilaginibacter rigui]|uniref:Uncharacterized protein n=1 Tax=Mucilaginibacter rigui TaxID=534635 RepID=A0ABR7X081_9SPHI|nr:hypothetical protein [Mucilaginibacter rigui]MBD1383983.1 hypothetical protein [Mucilaginibacter rigui]
MTKKYILKPGTHQFAPGSAAVHSNNNLTDEEAEWYLQRYPHIAKLFESMEDGKSGSQKDEKPGVKIKRKRIPKRSVESSKSE